MNGPTLQDNLRLFSTAIEFTDGKKQPAKTLSRETWT
jgi:hypothetical protein